jgi:hypothetical protein
MHQAVKYACKQDCRPACMVLLVSRPTLMSMHLRRACCSLVSTFLPLAILLPVLGDCHCLPGMRCSTGT